ncbi:thioesterase family protein [Salinibacterium sp. dk2585]|uniref:acyl-CoA thioesterase n=1 Tax=unclassified Salinibacterium TaxID=2632331 RepID=UPI0011C25296|nr:MULTISPECIES: thioesterase family protein [unclassified Salinibacterium]QEE60303.1 thioesterase family protein [Salinibacterium sp. dk2585]TXK55375.1 thioesterase family protein [Salinibacterium sp. dk5596]
MSSHAFDDAVALEPLGDGRFRGHTHPAYANMVGPFGGITAATLLRAVELHPDVLGAPLSLTVNFAGPVADGEFEIEAVPVRTNRSTQHWSLTLTQGGAIATTATAVFGQRRDTWSETETPAPDVASPEQLEQQRMPDIIVWARNYEMRFAEGIMTPGAGQASSSSTLWMRDAPPRPLDFASLAALCDAFYPRIFLRSGQMTPAGTVTLTIYFHADAQQLAAQGDAHMLATARGHRFNDGYFDQSATVWGHDGHLLASTHQLVYFKS